MPSFTISFTKIDFVHGFILLLFCFESASGNIQNLDKNSTTYNLPRISFSTFENDGTETETDGPNPTYWNYFGQIDGVPSYVLSRRNVNPNNFAANCEASYPIQFSLVGDYVSNTESNGGIGKLYSALVFVLVRSRALFTRSVRQ
jgi:hypothetical protein